MQGEEKPTTFTKDFQFMRFAAYGFLKNLRLFEPFMILFFRSQGFDFFQIGVLYSIMEISTNILEIPTGIFADTFGRRLSMVMSMSSYIISFLIFFLFPNFWMYAFAMVLFAMGEAFRSGTHKALILSYLKIKGWEHLKTQYYGATRSWSQMGSAVNAILAGILVVITNNYKAVFLFSLIPYIINLINLATYPKELDQFVKKKKKRETLGDFVSMFKDPLILRAFMNSSIFMGVFKGTKDYLQPILKDMALALPIFLWLSSKQKAAIVVGITYSIIYFINSMASRNAYKVKEHFSASLTSLINWLYIIGIIGVALAGIFYHFKLYYLAVLMFLVLYVLQNLRRPIMLDYISEIIPAGSMATGLSVESQIKSLLASVLAPFIGFLADKLGIGIALSTVGILSLVVFPMVAVKEKSM